MRRSATRHRSENPIPTSESDANHPPPGRGPPGSCEYGNRGFRVSDLRLTIETTARAPERSSIKSPSAESPLEIPSYMDLPRPNPRPVNLPTEIGGFRIQRVLGSGGM